MLVTKEFVFDAAHYLPFYHGKCENLHGHTWKMHVTVQGKVGPEGMAFDFVKLKEIVMERVIRKLDHQCINDLVPNPSAEHVALWTWHQLRELPLYEIIVWETPTSFATMHAADYVGYEPAPAQPAKQHSGHPKVTLNTR